MNSEDRKQFWKELTENIDFLDQQAQRGNHFRGYNITNGITIRVDVYVRKSTIERYEGDVVVSVNAKQITNVFCYTNAENVNKNIFIKDGRIGFSRQFNLGNKDNQDNWQQAIKWIRHGVEFFTQMGEMQVSEKNSK
jgi:hypothetical protein